MKDKGSIRLGIGALKEIQKSRGMSLEEAIEILTLSKTCAYEGDSKDLEDAHQLGIEAMKRTSQRRENLSWKFEPLLPGETID